jgi:hypothetical protein
MHTAGLDLARTVPVTAPGSPLGGARPVPRVRGRVLRLCSVFEPPTEALARPDAARFDPIGACRTTPPSSPAGSTGWGSRRPC